MILLAYPCPFLLIFLPSLPQSPPLVLFLSLNMEEWCSLVLSFFLYFFLIIEDHFPLFHQYVMSLFLSIFFSQKTTDHKNRYNSTSYEPL